MNQAPEKTPRGHDHMEAFCLMKYQSRDGKIVEWIWNSRDSVTPFIISSKDGKHEMQHVEWQRDEYRPGHRLQEGDRYFGEMTREAAERYAKRRMEQMDGTKYELQGDERATMQAELAKTFLEDTCPDLLVYHEPTPS